MNWKGCVKSKVVSQFKALSQHLLGETKENREKPLRIAGFQAEILLENSQIRNKNVNHSTMLSVIFIQFLGKIETVQSKSVHSILCQKIDNG
jgi:methyltransferase-like protein